MVRKPISAISSRTSSAMKKHIVDGMVGLADEALAQNGVLRRHADRAGVQVALPHHDAAGRDERRGGEAEFVGAEKGADNDIAAGPDAAIDLQGDAAAQTVTTSVWCVSARPISQGEPACLMRSAGRRRCRRQSPRW